MFNDNLKILRKEKGLSQEELAERLHVVRQTVSKWEKGLSVPDASDPSGDFLYYHFLILRGCYKLFIEIKPFSQEN